MVQQKIIEIEEKKLIRNAWIRKKLIRKKLIRNAWTTQNLQYKKCLISGKSDCKNLFYIHWWRRWYSNADFKFSTTQSVNYTIIET